MNYIAYNYIYTYIYILETFVYVMTANLQSFQTLAIDRTDRKISI